MLNKSNFLTELKKRIIYADGAMGTVLQQSGFKIGCPEELNLTNPELIKSVHKSYLDAGANILITNTFGGNGMKLKQYRLESKLKEINQAGVRIAKEVIENAKSSDCLVAADISELGEYIEPLGELTFDQAYDFYYEQMAALSEADIFFIETISDIKILKAALIAAKEFNKIIVVSMTFEGLRTPTGTDVKTYVKIADSLGADIIGANCSCGPKEMYSVAKIIAENTNKPIIIKPNAGLPKLIGGKTIFGSNIEEFCEYSKQFIDLGVNILGGCCGTNPEFIKNLVENTKHLNFVTRNVPLKTCFCSRTKTVELNNKTLIIGERINPTGRLSFREELKEGKIDTIRKEALLQKQQGASLLDINVGVPGTDEVSNLIKAINLVQSFVDLPLVIDTCNKDALEAALKYCEGKPLINSVNANINSLNNILPLVKKYGAAIIVLCLDKEGVPKTVEKRIEIAERIIQEAKNLGIPKEDIIVDCLTLTMATDPKNEEIILNAVKEIKQRGYRTVLGVSNISYGLPNRSEINQKFFSKASNGGLDLAILNPLDNVQREDTNINLNFEVKDVDYENLSTEMQLSSAIVNGDKNNISEIVQRSLIELSPLKINDILISGLEEVGKKFNAKKIFLPHVLLSADAMKIAFNILKEKLTNDNNKSPIKIVFATVENDVHDIGKNIVVAILESYGYQIIDLGKDVSMDKIINTALTEKANLIALSALMTTTAPEMEKIIKKLNEHKIKIPVLIGGAVITEDYAGDIGAAYSADALSAVRKIKEVIKNDEKNN